MQVTAIMVVQIKSSKPTSKFRQSLYLMLTQNRHHAINARLRKIISNPFILLLESADRERIAGYTLDKVIATFFGYYPVYSFFKSVFERFVHNAPLRPFVIRKK